MCGASNEGENEFTKQHKGRNEPSYAYVPVLFLEEKFEPHRWQDILATLDTCVEDIYSHYVLWQRRLWYHPYPNGSRYQFRAHG